MRIENITAELSPIYNPSTCYDGGGYFQPNGCCDVVLEDGTTLHAEYVDTSCGGFGDRWDLVFVCAGEEYVFREDDVGTSAEMQRDIFDANNDTWYRMEAVFGVDANELIHAVRCAICDAARDAWWAERYD